MPNNPTLKWYKYNWQQRVRCVFPLATIHNDDWVGVYRSAEAKLLNGFSEETQDSLKKILPQAKLTQLTEEEKADIVAALYLRLFQLKDPNPQKAYEAAQLARWVQVCLPQFVCDELFQRAILFPDWDITAVTLLDWATICRKELIIEKDETLSPQTPQAIIPLEPPIAPKTSLKRTASCANLTEFNSMRPITASPRPYTFFSTSSNTSIDTVTTVLIV